MFSEREDSFAIDPRDRIKRAGVLLFWDTEAGAAGATAEVRLGFLHRSVD